MISVRRVTCSYLIIFQLSGNDSSSDNDSMSNGEHNGDQPTKEREETDETLKQEVSDEDGKLNTSKRKHNTSRRIFRYIT